MKLEIGQQQSCVQFTLHTDKMIQDWNSAFSPAQFVSVEVRLNCYTVAVPPSPPTYLVRYTNRPCGRLRKYTKRLTIRFLKVRRDAGVVEPTRVRPHGRRDVSRAIQMCRRRRPRVDRHRTAATRRRRGRHRHGRRRGRRRDGNGQSPAISRHSCRAAAEEKEKKLGRRRGVDAARELMTCYRCRRRRRRCRCRCCW